METEKMIRELKRVEEIHKHDKVFTGDLNIAEMARDVRERLEELKPYEDTGLTPEQIRELKERNTAKASIDADNDYGFFTKRMNDGWIPVEKDLPKNESEVWVVLESTYGTGYRTYSSARYLYFENYGESHWCDNHYGYLEWDKYSDGHGGSSEYKVIAWQPIEPYRPVRSDNHDGE